MRKSVLVLAGVLVALFGLNRAGAIVSGGRYDSGSAWANVWTGTEDDGGASTEPDTAPPDISGAWSGTVTDSLGTTGSFALDITQKSGKLRGTWSGGLGSGGKFIGSVGGSGNISLKLLTPVQPKHKGCHVNAKGAATDHTIMMSWKAVGCGPILDKVSGTIQLSNL